MDNIIDVYEAVIADDSVTGIATTIRLRRAELCMSRADLAIGACMSMAMLAKIENGDRLCQMTDLSALARGLHWTIRDMLTVAAIPKGRVLVIGH